MSERNYRKGSLVWPVVLIGLGIVFLLNNLGVLSWDVWAMLVRMWPVLLVAIGLDLLLGRRSSVGSAIVVFLMVGMFAAFFWTMNLTGEIWNGDSVSESIAYELGRNEKATVRIDHTIGELVIGSLDEEDELFVEGEVVISEDERLSKTFDVEDGVIEFSLSSKGQQYYPGWLFSNQGKNDKTWTLDFSRDVFLDLSFDNGVGRTDLDLTELQISSLEVNGGVGEVSVSLPDSGIYRVVIDAGVGMIDVRLPDRVAAEIHVDNGVGNVSIIGDFSRQGNMYVSDGFDEAEHQATIYLDGGVGNIRLIETGD